MKTTLYLCLFFFGLASAQAGTTVIYFGGYGASPAQMKCWEQGARKNPAYSAYTFKSVPYPVGAGAGKASAVAGGSKSIAAVVREIANNPNEKYIIVGHSSGAALSNAVGSRVSNASANTKQIQLVNLDGFAPSAELQKRVKTTCVYAKNSETGLKSRNAFSMKGNCRNSVAYEDTHCKTAWCMHFSLVNTKTPANLGAGSFRSSGYQGCATNLSWLPAKSLSDTDSRSGTEKGGTSAQ
ncbi:MAG: hypothetical protein ACXWQO_14215 [Bdellovibrionota bacterium]